MSENIGPGINNLDALSASNRPLCSGTASTFWLPPNRSPIASSERCRLLLVAVLCPCTTKRDTKGNNKRNMPRRFPGVFLVLALSALAFMTVTPALADMVTYSTTGGFPVATSETFGVGPNTLTLTYTGIVPASVDTPSNGSAGFITASITGTGASASGPFMLTIDQIAPTVATGGFSGALSGLITSDSSMGTLDFSTTSLTLGDEVYTLQQPLGGYALVPPNTNGGVTSIQLHITTSVVPEPLFLGLTGLGLFGIVGITFLRNRRLRARG
jgi:hypothetical protein